MQDDRFESAFNEIFGVCVQQIPMGKTTIKDPNKNFSITMQAQSEAKKYREAQRKHLPLPKWRR